MKICVVGAGAIGGLIAVRIEQLGYQVSVVARGEHLAAIKAKGLKLIEKGIEHISTTLFATDNISSLNAQDIIFLGLKAHQIESVADDLSSLVGPNTVMITLQNGIPWWYFRKFDGPYSNRTVRTVDPNSVLFDRIDPEILIGCVAYPAATLVGPGVIRHIEGYRFPVGELDGQTSDRVLTISRLLTKAGFKAHVLADIRSEIWLKLWGNLSFNPISALTHSTLVDICQFPPTRELSAAMMREAQAVGEKLGAHFRVSLEKRILGAEAVGKHKTSMLQDLEAGKPLEIEGMLGAVIELAEVTKVEVPTLKVVYACVSLLDKTIREENRAL